MRLAEGGAVQRLQSTRRRGSAAYEHLLLLGGVALAGAAALSMWGLAVDRAIAGETSRAMPTAAALPSFAGAGPAVQAGVLSSAALVERLADEAVLLGRPVKRVNALCELVTVPDLWRAGRPLPGEPAFDDWARRVQRASEKFVIAQDIDGTIADNHLPLLLEMERMHRLPRGTLSGRLDYDWFFRDLSDWAGRPIAESFSQDIVPIFQKLMRDGTYEHLDAYPGSAETLHRVHDLGAEVAYVTDRVGAPWPARAAGSTVPWLENAGFPLDRVSMHFGKNKRRVAGSMSVALDDGPENIAMYLEEGVPVLAPAQAYTAGLGVPRYLSQHQLEEGLLRLLETEGDPAARARALRELTVESEARWIPRLREGDPADLVQRAMRDPKVHAAGTSPLAVVQQRLAELAAAER